VKGKQKLFDKKEDHPKNQVARKQSRLPRGRELRITRLRQTKVADFGRKAVAEPLAFSLKDKLDHL